MKSLQMCLNCVNYHNNVKGSRDMHECQHPNCDCSGGFQGKDHVVILPVVTPGSKMWKEIEDGTGL